MTPLVAQEYFSGIKQEYFARQIGAAALCLLLSGCAFGRISVDGELVGFAAGPTARISICREGYENEAKQQSTLAGRECREIHGSPISTGFAEFLATIGTAVGAYFGLGL